MKEYIEREAAVEWFMAFVHMGESDIPVETVITDLKCAIPAADVAPVVRCCSCEFHDHDGGSGYCNYWRRWSDMDDFCSRGERE